MPIEGILPPNPPNWRPSTAAITATEFHAEAPRHNVLVVHFWALWNAYDRHWDRALAPLRRSFGDRIAIRSMDCDDGDVLKIAESAGVLNLPALGIWTHGDWVESIVGCVDLAKVRSAVDAELHDSDAER